MVFILPAVIIVGILAWVLRPGKSPINHRRIAILVTILPSLVVAIAAIAFQLLHNTEGTVEVSNVSNTCFIVGLGLICAAILAFAGFALAHKGEVAKGIGFGICIAVITSIIELGLLEWLGGV